MKKLILLLIGLSFFVVDIFAQKDTVKSSSYSPNLYYTDQSHLLALRLFSTFRLNSMKISNDQGHLALIPNSPIIFGRRDKL